MKFNFSKVYFLVFFNLFILSPIFSMEADEVQVPQQITYKNVTLILQNLNNHNGLSIFTGSLTMRNSIVQINVYNLFIMTVVITKKIQEVVSKSIYIRHENPPNKILENAIDKALEWIDKKTSN